MSHAERRGWECARTHGDHGAKPCYCCGVLLRMPPPPSTGAAPAERDWQTTSDDVRKLLSSRASTVCY